MGLRTIFEYSTDLFDEATIASLAEHYQQLLESMVDSPDRQVSHVSLLTPAEYNQLVVGRNQTAVDYPSARYAHEWCENGRIGHQTPLRQCAAGTISPMPSSTAGPTASRAPFSAWVLGRMSWWPCWQSAASICWLRF